MLREMKATVDETRANGLGSLPMAVRREFVTRYRALLAVWHAANPPPAQRPRRRGRAKQSPRATCSNGCGWARTRCW